MAGYPTRRIFYENTFLKFQLRGYVSPCVKYFSSKDSTTDVDITNTKPDKDLQEKKPEESSSSNKILNASNDKEVPEKQKKEAAKKKLFSLLSELKVSDGDSKIRPDLTLAKPVKRISKAERFADILKKKKSPTEAIDKAVGAVAESIGGNPEETETELKQKLSSINLIPDTSKPEYKASDMGIDEKLQDELMSSVKDVASTVPTPIRSKLTQRLMKLSLEKRDGKQAKISTEDMMKGLKVEKKKVTRGRAVRELIPKEEKVTERKDLSRPRFQTRVNIFQAAPLDIFSCDVESKEETEQTVWTRLEEKKLKLLTEYAPANAFEEMIMWTEQGKHWKFPIDNETEMGEEENIGFHEHVFLEHHLHGFPTKGPIRHFMELVCLGLSKNPYITVDRKIENINWFRDYFKEKEEILKQCGALG